MEVRLKPQAQYAVVSDSGCTVSYVDAAGNTHLMLTVPAHVQKTFVCMSARTIVDDDAARVVELPGDAEDAGDSTGQVFAYHRTAVGGQNCNAVWWKLNGRYNSGGELKEVRVPARQSASAPVTTDPVYLSVWYEDAAGTPRHLGVSTDASAFEVGGEYIWHFSGVELPAGRVLRFCVVSSRDKDWDDSCVIGLRTHARETDDTVSNVSHTSPMSVLADCTLMLPFDDADTSDLAELLAHKDELLALLSTSSTSLNNEND